MASKNGGNVAGLGLDIVNPSQLAKAIRAERGAACKCTRYTIARVAERLGYSPQANGHWWFTADQAAAIRAELQDRSGRPAGRKNRPKQYAKRTA